MRSHFYCFYLDYVQNPAQYLTNSRVFNEFCAFFLRNGRALRSMKSLHRQRLVQVLTECSINGALMVNPSLIV